MFCKKEEGKKNYKSEWDMREGHKVKRKRERE